MWRLYSWSPEVQVVEMKQVPHLHIYGKDVLLETRAVAQFAGKP